MIRIFSPPGCSAYFPGRSRQKRANLRQVHVQLLVQPEQWYILYLLQYVFCSLLYFTQLHLHTERSYTVFDLNRLCCGRNKKREQDPLRQSLGQSKLLRKRQALLRGLEMNWKIFLIGLNLIDGLCCSCHGEWGPSDRDLRQTGHTAGRGAVFRLQVFCNVH